jgi:hypothetical protein
MSWLKQFDLNAFLRETPVYLRALVIISLCGVIIIAVGLIGVAAIRGQSIHAWVFTIDEYKDPTTQKCQIAAQALTQLLTVNQQTLDQLPTQTGQISLQRAADVGSRNSVVKDLSNNPTLAKLYDDRIADHDKRIQALDKLREDITSSRKAVADNVLSACGVGQRT